jgi:hypothetical protein
MDAARAVLRKLTGSATKEAVERAAFEAAEKAWRQGGKHGSREAVEKAAQEAAEQASRGAPPGSAARGAATEARSVIQFGKDPNQISHAFRHTDAAGLERSVVQSAVEGHLRTVESQIVAAKPFNQVIKIAGQRIQYTAFRLPDGVINVGRIHPVP